MKWLREAIGSVRIYIGGLPWRLINGWTGRDRTTGKLSPQLVLARGGRGGRRWKFSAALRGAGVYTCITHAGGRGGGTGASLPRPLSVQVSGQVVGGAVARDVADVVIEFDGGGSLHAPLLGHGFPARFYVSDVPAPLIPAAVAAYDRNGALLKRVELRREPPPTAGDRAPLPPLPHRLALSGGSTSPGAEPRMLRSMQEVADPSTAFRRDPQELPQRRTPVLVRSSGATSALSSPPVCAYIRVAPQEQGERRRAVWTPPSPT
ncbi:MAG: hypothetical protein M3O70_19440 [Actinomycetota bacterium]|nr:hypothetical protein [Actinomycetota bacterium]